MVSVTVIKDIEGTTVAFNGVLQTIHFTKAPVEPGEWFTLVDDSAGFDRILFNMQTSSMPFPSGTDIMTSGGIPFTNLTVRSISVDSQFDIEYDPVTGSLTPPPPVVTAITPNTSNKGNQLVTVTGSGFTAQSIINFGGVDQATTFVDAGTLTASLRSGGRGVYEIFVRDVGGDSNSVQFTFT